MRELNESDVQVYKDMMLYLNEDSKKDLIKGLRDKFYLSSYFVRSFEEYFDSEIFSNWPNVKASLIDCFPNLFDADIWLNNSEKNLENLLVDNFVEKYNIDIEKSLTPMKKFSVGKELFNRLNGKFSEDRKFIGSLLELLNFDPLENKSPEDRKSILLSMKKLPSTLNLTSEEIELYLKNSPFSLSIQDVLSAISKTNDMGWKNRMIDEIESGIIDATNSNACFDELIYSVLTSIGFEKFEKFFKILEEKAPNSISYKTLLNLLSFEPEEELCLKLVPHFKRNNLVKALGEYCKEKDYKRVILAICV